MTFYEPINNGEDVLAILKREGISHIVTAGMINPANRHWRYEVSYQKNFALADFTRKYLKLLYSANDLSLYKIIYP